MSSNEEDFNDGERSKKRRIQRACDVCRRKKIRCDGVQMPGNQCSNCIAYNLECTYVETAKKRGPPKAYVEALENRIEKMEGLLRRLMPDTELARELGLGPSSPGTSSPLPPPQSQPAYRPEANEIVINAIRKWDQVPNFSQPQNDEDSEHVELADNLKSLHVDSREYRFFGKSSGAMLVKTAIDLKQEFTGRETNMVPLVRGDRRPEFWRPLPWEDTINDIPKPIYDFPDQDLLVQLVDGYFTHLNIYFPLLHRPTFERSLREGLHHRDDLFAAIVLLVCATGSRYVDDTRVLLEGSNSWHSAGWKYFDKVQVVRKSLLAPPVLYDLQFYCLSVFFLQGSSAPHSCWTLVGIGIRLAQDVGAHRRRPNKPLTVEDELWKRAFWCLVCMDRVLSTGLGRPCAIQDEDYDLELPVECDDEYWEHSDPVMAFKQPPGNPSVVAAFTAYIKLNLLLSMALRTIYAINKSKILLGFAGNQWQQHIVAELDSALNQWVDSVPDHLRWDPTRSNQLFFNQSVFLYTQYYHVQILVHRPFIPSPKKPSPLSFPSLAICTNAARSVSHIIDLQRRRGEILMPLVQITVFTAGIVLLLNIWGGKRSGLATDPNKEMADVYKCMQAMKVSEKKWHSAGRVWDILYELASVGELPLPNSSTHTPPPHTGKRERGIDDPNFGSNDRKSIGSPASSDISMEPRSIAGSRRVSAATASSDATANVNPNTELQKTSSSSSMAASSSNIIAGFGGVDNALSPFSSASSSSPGMQLFSLPMYSDELGRLPLHGQFNFSSSSTSAKPHEHTPLQPQEQSSVDWFHESFPGGGPSGLNPQSVQPSGYYGYGFGGGSGSEAGPGPNTSQVSMSDSAAGGYRSQHPPPPSGPRAGIGSPLRPLRPQVRGMPNPNQNQNQAQSVGDGNAMNIGMNMSPLSLDSDTFAMWSSAPSGFELDDWGTYLNNVSELTQTMNMSRGQDSPLNFV